MRGRAAGIATVVCLVVAVLFSIVWVRGLIVRDQLVTHVAGRKLIAGNFPHHLHVLVFPEPVGRTPTAFEAGLRQYPSRPIYWELRYQHRPNGSLRIFLPYWLPLAFALVPPLWWVIERIQRARRRHSGLCRGCGYDLRASRDRCPECGEPIPEALPASAVPSLT